jgi:transcription elongation factor SPT4
MTNNSERIASCTTTYFDGVIAVVDPEASWVARWQRTCAFCLFVHCYFGPCLLIRWFDVAKYVRGMYAVRVKGRIPEDVEAELESRGIKYRSRDQTDQD